MQDLECFRVEVESHVAAATMRRPPVNARLLGWQAPMRKGR